MLRSSVLVAFACDWMVYMMASSGITRWLGYHFCLPLVPLCPLQLILMALWGLGAFQPGRKWVFPCSCMNIYHHHLWELQHRKNWLGLGSVTRNLMYMTQKYLVCRLITSEIMTLCLTVWISKEFNLPCHLDQNMLTNQSIKYIVIRNTDLCQMWEEKTST